MKQVCAVLQLITCLCKEKHQFIALEFHVWIVVHGVALVGALKTQIVFQHYWILFVLHYYPLKKN